MAPIDELPGWRPPHTKFLVFSSQTDLQLTNFRAGGHLTPTF
jgi:hypothetical protein